jgi:hypothetical protein
MQAYEHRQWAPLNLLIVIVTAVAAMFAGPRYGPVYALTILGALVFARLTTRVDREGISWSFTLGVPAGRLVFAELDHAELTRTNLFEGWGLHWSIWHGWVWNVWGFRAVELFLRNGQRETIGTDDPQGLFAAIEQFRRQS